MSAPRRPARLFLPIALILSSLLVAVMAHAGSVATTTTTSTTTSTTTAPPTTTSTTTTTTSTSSTTSTTDTTTTTLPLYREELAPEQLGSFNSNNLPVRSFLRCFSLEHGWALFDLTGWSAEDFESAKLTWTSTWNESGRDGHNMTVFAFEDPIQQAPLDEAGHVVQVVDGGCYGPGNESFPNFDANCPAHTKFLFDSETEANSTGLVTGCDYSNTFRCTPSHDVTRNLQALLGSGATRIVFAFFNDNSNQILSDGAPELQLFVNDGVCGDPVGSMPKSARDASSITATDALFILRAAVGSESCDPCLCDADGSGTVSATDALTILRIAVGENRVLLCPDCEL